MWNMTEPEIKAYSDWLDTHLAVLSGDAVWRFRMLLQEITRLRAATHVERDEGFGGRPGAAPRAYVPYTLTTTGTAGPNTVGARLRAAVDQVRQENAERAARVGTWADVERTTEPMQAWGTGYRMPQWIEERGNIETTAEVTAANEPAAPADDDGPF